MPPKPDRSHRRRSTIQAQVQKILDFAIECVSDTSFESISVRLNKLPALYADFQQIDDEICDNFEEESELLPFDELYYEAQTKLNEKLRTCNNKPAPPHNSSRVHNLNNTSISLDNAFINSLLCDSKSSGISLPKFGGQYEDWQTFIDLFNKTVHENETINGAQKLTFLKLALKDEAYQLIRHMPVSEAGYIEVYEKLNKRYSKKKLILNQFIQQFLDLKLPSNTNKIRFICDKSDEIIRGIKSLGDDAQSRDVWLIHIILNKLNEETQQQRSKKTSDTEFPTWKMFQDFLTKQADAIEFSHSSSISKSNYNTNQCRNKLPIRAHTTSTNFNCSLCQTNHKLYECPEFKKMNITYRKEFILTNKRCYNYLNDTHTVMQCKSKRSCLKCKKRHHTLLHISPDSSNFSTTDTDQRDIKRYETSETHEPKPSTSNTIVSTQTSTNNIARGLLQTASVNIRGANQ